MQRRKTNNFLFLYQKKMPEKQFPLFLSDKIEIDTASISAAFEKYKSQKDAGR